MIEKAHSIFDTDMHIFRKHPDLPIKQAAQKMFDFERPTAMSAFSLVELKGNYIQDLILLRRKVWESTTFPLAMIKIGNSGSRKSRLMLLQLISWLGGAEFEINPWQEAKRQLITHLDAQIVVSWQEFQTSVDTIFDDFNCTRASESPNDDDGTWHASIPWCQKGNTKCTIVAFIKQYLDILNDFDKLIDAIPLNAELLRIKKVVKQTIETSIFPWQGSQCRSVGDLLIGLQTKARNAQLITSNINEHDVLSQILGYSILKFPVSEYKTK